MKHTEPVNRYVDPQGRIILPAHIRKALNLQPGNLVSMEVTENGTIKIRVEEERCSLCGESVEGKHHAKIKVGPVTKNVCYNCSQAIAREMMK